MLAWFHSPRGEDARKFSSRLNSRVKVTFRLVAGRSCRVVYMSQANGATIPQSCLHIYLCTATRNQSQLHSTHYSSNLNITQHSSTFVINTPPQHKPAPLITHPPPPTFAHCRPPPPIAATTQHASRPRPRPRLWSGSTAATCLPRPHHNPALPHFKSEVRPFFSVVGSHQRTAVSSSLLLQHATQIPANSENGHGMASVLRSTASTTLHCGQEIHHVSL